MSPCTFSLGTSCCRRQEHHQKWGDDFHFHLSSRWCSRQSQQDCLVILPTVIVRCTESKPDDMAKQIVMLCPFYPNTWRYVWSPLRERVWFLAVHISKPYSSMNTARLWFANSENQQAYSWRRSNKSGLRPLGSAECCRDNLKVYAIPYNWQ